MSRPRFLADQNLDEDIVRGLLRHEPAAEFMLARDMGVDRLPDDALLQFAADQRLIVVSHDVNTLRHAGYERLRAGLPMPGLFLIVRNKPIARPLRTCR